jgi:hypothetical protein
MINRMKLMSVMALATAALVGCGGGGSTSEAQVKSVKDFFSPNATYLAGFPQCVFTPKDAGNADAQDVANKLNMRSYPNSNNMNQLCAVDLESKLININSASSNGYLVVRNVGGVDRLVHEFNGTADRLIITDLDGDQATTKAMEAQAGGFDFIVSLGQVDDAATEGRVDIVNTFTLINRENSQIDVLPDGRIDLTPEGESNRFVDVLMIEDGGVQDWFANAADDLFEFANINDVTNKEYIDFLKQGVEYSDEIVPMLLTYSRSTNGHANGITGTYYVYHNDVEFDEGDVTIRTVLKNMQTRIVIDGSGNASGVIKEMIAYDANQGEDVGQVLIRIYNRDTNPSVMSMQMAVAAMSGSLGASYVQAEEGTLLEETLQQYDVTPVDLEALLSEVELVTMEGDMLL